MTDIVSCNPFVCSFLSCGYFSHSFVYQYSAAYSRTLSHLFLCRSFSSCPINSSYLCFLQTLSFISVIQSSWQTQPQFPCICYSLEILKAEGSFHLFSTSQDCCSLLPLCSVLNTVVSHRYIFFGFFRLENKSVLTRKKNTLIFQHNICSIWWI